MRALIFDVDGVLAATEGPIFEAAGAWFQESHGVTLEHDVFQRFIGTGSERLMLGVAEHYGVDIDLAAALDDMHARFDANIDRANSLAFPGAIELISAMAGRSGWRLGIATSSPEKKSRRTLQKAGVDLGLFDAYIHGDLVTRKKPDPEIYRMAAAALYLPPERCVVIEDAVNGVAAAAAAGMACVAVAHTFSCAKLAEADHCADAIAALRPELFDALLEA